MRFRQLLDSEVIKPSLSREPFKSRRDLDWRIHLPSTFVPPLSEAPAILALKRGDFRDPLKHFHSLHAWPVFGERPGHIWTLRNPFLQHASSRQCLFADLHGIYL